MSESQTYVLTLAYNGTNFAGFARQKDARVTTVQGELETALATVLRLPEPPQTVCAGRTDAGVHALGQVVSFDLDDPTAVALIDSDTRQVLRSLGALTPESMSILELSPAPSGFSARFDAVSREYRYRIVNRPAPPVFNAAFAWHVPQALDLEAMREAAGFLIGEHDFCSFCLAASATEDKNTVRTLSTLDITTEESLGEPLLVIRCVGNAFLHNMVRSIVGTLVEVGHGKRKPADLPDILAARDRQAAGQTAPAHGLVFHHVEWR